MNSPIGPARIYDQAYRVHNPIGHICSLSALIGFVSIVIMRCRQSKKLGARRLGANNSHVGKTGFTCDLCNSCVIGTYHMEYL